MIRHRLPAALAAVALSFASANAPADDAAARAPFVDVRGVDHVGINVPDVEAASRFFHDFFGFATVTDMHDLPVDAGFRKTFHMHDDAEVKVLRMMRAGDGANIELFQYASKQASREQPYYDDIAASHIAFYTDDIARATAALRAHGITVLTDPIAMTQGPAAGNTWVYFVTPWGAKMELVSYPHGQAGEAASGVRLWKAPSRTPETPDRAAVDELVRQYVAMLNEPDASHRARTIDRFYTDDTVFNDPEGFIRGKAALNALVGKLQTAHKGFTFRQKGNVTVQNGMLRVPWTYGPAAQPSKIVGEDIITLIDGRIANTAVFLDGKPH